MTDAALLNELTLVPDAFKSSHSLTGLMGFAKRLQTLIIMEPKTLPNLVDAGVGIGLYLSEIADDQTLELITERIFSQVKTYLPNNIVKSIDVKLVQTSDSANPILAVFFSIAETEEKNKTFALTFGTNSKSSVVKSDFYF